MNRRPKIEELTTWKHLIKGHIYEVWIIVAEITTIPPKSFESKALWKLRGIGRFDQFKRTTPGIATRKPLPGLTWLMFPDEKWQNWESQKELLGKKALEICRFKKISINDIPLYMGEFRSTTELERMLRQ